jgi:cation diffusion facilitator CzcD-associated flavoprotein CzcO
MEQTNTLIVGAGPAGLAVAACLKRDNIPFIVLERESTVGSSWRRHYDRLHLHTPRRHSALPFLPFPEDYPRYATRDQFVEYLESYAFRFRIAPRFGHCVVHSKRESSLWTVTTDRGSFESDNLVLCTGYNCDPLVPSWPGMDSFPGPILHSSEYRNGKPFWAKRVLVVGFGNSGGEIAIDLSEHGALPTVVVRSAVNVIPRDIYGQPATSVSILSSKLPAKVADRLNAPLLRRMYGDITELGFRKLPYGPVEQIKSHSRIPLIDIGTIDLVRAGRIQVRPGIERFDGRDVMFEDHLREPFDAVVLATGYTPNLSSILGEHGQTLTEHSTQIPSGTQVAPGLFLCGFRVPPTGTLREIGIEAKGIARIIAKRGTS